MVRVALCAYWRWSSAEPHHASSHQHLLAPAGWIYATLSLGSLGLSRLIPRRLDQNSCATDESGGRDASELVDEHVSGVRAVADDVLVGFEDEV